MKTLFVFLFSLFILSASAQFRDKKKENKHRHGDCFPLSLATGTNRAHRKSKESTG
jgi:hypothetical protein